MGMKKVTVQMASFFNMVSMVRNLCALAIRPRQAKTFGNQRSNDHAVIPSHSNVVPIRVDCHAALSARDDVPDMDILFCGMGWFSGVETHPGSGQADPHRTRQVTL